MLPPAWFSLEDVSVLPFLVALVGVLLGSKLVLERTWKRRAHNDGEEVFAVILGISTGNPEYRVSKEQAFLHATEATDPSSPVARVLDRVYNNSRIDGRYFCIPDLLARAGQEGPGLGSGHSAPSATPAQDAAAAAAEAMLADSILAGEGGIEVGGGQGVGAGAPMFYPADGSFRVNTDRRFQRFAECALPLATEVATRAIREVGASPADIGRIVVVTSTGVCGPGLDGDLIKCIGLNHSVEREAVSFQGCGAGINGLRLASRYAITHPGRLALLVSVELPSLHMHKGDTVNEAILHAIFGDGCAAAIVAGRTARSAEPGSLAVLDNRSWLVDGTEEGIRMTFGENGVSCKLSKRLPDYVKTNVADFVDEMLGAHGVDKSEIDFWALHPGGHRIVEETRKSLHLSLEETESSWGVLREYGNMVSATVLFVLERALAEHKRLRESGSDTGLQHVVALSFSPGVTVEGLLLKAMPPAAPTYIS